MSVEINPSHNNAVFSVSIANELGTPVRSGYARKASVKAALGVPEILEYKISIPSESAATLSSVPFELTGLSGSFAIISGLIYLSGEASDRLDNIVSFSIIDDSGNVVFKSAPISDLDPRHICFVSSALAETNVPSSSSSYSLKTGSDATAEPGGDLVVLLYLIDFSSKI